MKPMDQMSKGGRIHRRNDPLNDRPRGIPNHNSYAFKSPATKSLLKFRQRQELQRTLKARQYKSYKRVMKQEGFDVSHGKRKYQLRDEAKGTESLDSLQEMEDSVPKSEAMLPEENNFAKDSEKKKSLVVAGQRHSNSEPSLKIPLDRSRNRRLSDNSGVSKAHNVQQKHHTTSRYQQKLKEKEYLERQQRMEQEKSRKLKERHQRHKLLSARTPRGQPIMNNLVQDILRKLQNEKAGDDK